MRLTLPAFAKINLGLEVAGKRPDGYHELVTVFQTISLHDTLVFEKHWGPLTLICRARGVPEGPGNLVHRAAVAFGRAVGRPQKVRIRLTKRIPAQAGLGGGSSDAAVTLIALNTLAGRPLGPEGLANLAIGLGSDVPFFLLGGTALGLGRGEILRPLRDLEPANVVVAAPDFGVSTREAFERLDATLTRGRGQISIYRFSRQWVRGSGVFAAAPNDLERAVVPAAPSLARLSAALRSMGATAAAMTGSGSAVYGLFAGEEKAKKAFVRIVKAPRVSGAWLVRTVGAAEYAGRVILAEPGKAGGPRKGRNDGYHGGQDLPGRGGKAQGVRVRHF